MLTKVVWKNNEKINKVNKAITVNWVINMITLVTALGLYLYGHLLEKTNRIITVNADELEKYVKQ